MKKKKTKKLEPEIINKKSKNHPKFEKGRFFDSGFLNTQSQQLLDSAILDKRNRRFFDTLFWYKDPEVLDTLF